MTPLRCRHAMNIWPTPTTSAPAGAPQAALAGVIEGIGEDGFAEHGLRELNRGLPAASWSVYQVWHDRPPVLHLSSSLGVADTTRDCFGAYRDGLYLRDRSFDALRQVAPGHAAVLRMGAEDAPNEEHRERIYRRHRMIERLSVARREADGSLLAVNLYRHAHQPRFSGDELDAFTTMATSLLAAVRRHLALVESVRQPPWNPREAMARACPALTQRELDVCERLLRGWSYDGVAADMGLSVATVKTYRARAFERLGLHFRSELFARFGAPPRR
ncbi:response regulator transcription factor [Caldimonas thermodepolymerans]|uniref:DNA-binding NarL/FixJ family response regulator n=2 Tax=Caldimonas thermodepolymerans TaxID=215580 RepID=A0A2S5T136_9BURK|nr:LuxR C-terminal-related transcriptional regulator [Caldimonas thermodepolymerans]PPE68690.1 helix-turn-helix transcriptional regulator [Caldimonas thermodepolymerans]RDH95125.1 DNA-binding NarL/FixJ family response regulator [Caldimonas thermodepolymerans]TCP03250.1 DNA-binding NarL/FixJ family response regulator [Caldimonas thermodepolymerans]